MEVSYQLKATRTSTVNVHIREVGTVGQGTGYWACVTRVFDKRRDRKMECGFTAARMSSALAGLFAAVIAKGKGGRDPLDLAVIADAIQEHGLWQSPSPDLAWFLEQLRLVGGVKPVRGR